MKVGDKVKRKVEFGSEGGSLLPAMEGTVVYVHPEGRFYTVEFCFGTGDRRRCLRESYPWKSRQIVETAEDEHRPGAGPRLPGRTIGWKSYSALYLEQDYKNTDRWRRRYENGKHHQPEGRDG